jgi:hypothetical protein
MLMKVKPEILARNDDCTGFSKSIKYIPNQSLNGCRKGCNHCDTCDTKRTESIKTNRFIQKA